MTEIGFSLEPQYTLPTERVIELLGDAGFSAVSPLWSPELDLQALSRQVRGRGMAIQSLHAPHKNIPMLWQPEDPLSIEAQNRIMDCIDACARYEIPLIVIHGWQGLQYTFPETPLDFRFFDRMADHARQQQVCIAFENLEGEEYLAALLARYRQEQIGFCWDSGHDHCYPHTTDFLKTFGHRLVMTHLNDNFGLRDPGGIPSGCDDLHLLPWDGNILWENELGRLKGLPRQKILNFEIKVCAKPYSPEAHPYSRIPLEQLLETAGERARKIAALYDEKKA